MSNLIIAGQVANVVYSRATNLMSSLGTITLVANQCVYCERHTDRYNATFRDGKPWKAIPVCDDCHEHASKLPVKDVEFKVEIV